MPRSKITEYREGLIVGSACERGELYRSVVLNQPEEKSLEIAKFYDYLEIQPNGNNMFMVRSNDPKYSHIKTKKDLEEVNKKIVALADTLQKPVVATGDVHFMDPEDAIFRTILMAGQGFQDADTQPPLYFKTKGHHFDERVLTKLIEITQAQLVGTYLRFRRPNNNKIMFTYRSFWKPADAPASQIYDFEPYAVKMFHRRWYVLGRFGESPLRVFALDSRMSDVDFSDETFQLPDDFDAETMFRNCYGIILPDEGSEVQVVRLRVNADQSHYIRSLPLHHRVRLRESNRPQPVPSQRGFSGRHQGLVGADGRPFHLGLHDGLLALPPAVRQRTFHSRQSAVFSR